MDGRVGRSIPKFLVCHHCCEEWNVGRLGLDGDELLPVEGDMVEHFPDHGFPLLLSYPWV